MKIVRKFHRTVKPKWLFLIEDNATCHTKLASKTQVSQWFHLEMLPPQSPDLNPIENLWNHLKSRMPSRLMKKEQLVGLIKTEWEAMGQQFVRQFLRSMKRRCAAVIESRGGPTKY